MASEGAETPLYKWTQRKDEVIVTLKPPVDAKSLQCGDLVMVHGLQKAASFNWVSAIVVGPLKNGRFRVRCELPSRKEINVKPKNLCLRPERDDVKVEFASKSLKVWIGKIKVIDGTLKDIVLTDECTWYMADGLPEILLSKHEKDWWAGVIEGDEEIDVAIAEGKTFLNDKMMGKLRQRKAKLKAMEMETRTRPKSRKEMWKFFSDELQREKDDFKKNFDKRSFALWTRKTRYLAKLPITYTNIGNVCSPIRCVENRSKCTIRERVDEDTMYGLQSEAEEECKRIHELRIKKLQKRLEIVKENNKKPEIFYVKESEVIPKPPEKVWKLVFPLSHVVYPHRLKSSSCRSTHKTNSTFKVRLKSKITETYRITSLSHQDMEVKFELVSRSSQLDAKSAKHCIKLSALPISTEGKMRQHTKIEMETVYSPDASADLLAEDRITKLDAFEWILREFKKQNRRILTAIRKNIPKKKEEKKRLTKEDTERKKVEPEEGGDEKVYETEAVSKPIVAKTLEDTKPAEISSIHAAKTKDAALKDSKKASDKDSTPEYSCKNPKDSSSGMKNQESKVKSEPQVASSISNSAEKAREKKFWSKQNIEMLS